MRTKQRRYKRVPLKLISELNMTPVIDVTFLMLIAFLVTYPLMESSVFIRLPRATLNQPPPPDQKKPHNIAINATGEIFFDNAAISLEELQAELTRRIQEDPQTAVTVRGDESITYGEFMKVTAVLNKAKVTRMQLLTFAEGKQ